MGSGGCGVEGREGDPGRAAGIQGSGAGDQRGRAAAESDRRDAALGEGLLRVHEPMRCSHNNLAGLCSVICRIYCIVFLLPSWIYCALKRDLVPVDCCLV